MTFALPSHKQYAIPFGEINFRKAGLATSVFVRRKVDQRESWSLQTQTEWLFPQDILSRLISRPEEVTYCVPPTTEIRRAKETTRRSYRSAHAFWSVKAKETSLVSATFTLIAKAKIRDPQVKDRYHGELVIPPSARNKIGKWQR